MSSTQGIDVSAYQLDLTVHDLSGLSFAFTKATDGLTITDPHLANNWAVIKAAGLHRGAYHELQAGHPGRQASCFLAAVQGHGLEPGDMLAVVASDYPGVTDADVLAFCEAVRAVTGGRNPVLPYTDLSVGRGLTATARAFGDLWVAWPSPVAPSMPLGGWRSWRIWQWGTRGVPGLGSVDANAYNGTPADMGTWIASFKPKPPPKPKPATQEDDVAMLAAGTGAQTIIRFAAGSCKGIAFANDATMLKQPAPVLRVAAHSASGRFHVDQAFILTASGADEFAFAAGDVDFVNITRASSGAGDAVAVGWSLT